MGIVNAQQVKADVYSKLNKELLVFVEDVLLNRRPDSTVHSKYTTVFYYSILQYTTLDIRI